MKNLMQAIVIVGCLFGINMATANAANFSNIGSSAKIGSNGYSQQVNHQRYGDLPAYLVEMRNGQLIPQRLVVPPNQKFRIVVRNIGNKPAEFESNQLRQEKVLYMGTESVVVVMPLSEGTYDYYDDFTPGRKGVIVVK